MEETRGDMEEQDEQRMRRAIANAPSDKVRELRGIRDPQRFPLRVWETKPDGVGKIARRNPNYRPGVDSPQNHYTLATAAEIRSER